MQLQVVNYATGQPDGNIPGAGTVVISTPFIGLGQADIEYIGLHAQLVFGAGGTSIDAYFQTSFDNGLTWCDIANLQVLAASIRKVGAVNKYIAAAAPATPTDGTLAANTINNGLMGSLFRLKLILVGTYDAASTYRFCIAVHKTK